MAFSARVHAARTHRIFSAALPTPASRAVARRYPCRQDRRGGRRGASQCRALHTKPRGTLPRPLYAPPARSATQAGTARRRALQGPGAGGGRCRSFERGKHRVGASSLPAWTGPQRPAFPDSTARVALRRRAGGRRVRGATRRGAATPATSKRPVQNTPCCCAQCPNLSLSQLDRSVALGPSDSKQPVNNAVYIQRRHASPLLKCPLLALLALTVAPWPPARLCGVGEPPNAALRRKRDGRRRGDGVGSPASATRRPLAAPVAQTAPVATA